MAVGHEGLDLYEFDQMLYAERNAGWICGVDEAGRGPLAGPVFAAAVILPKEHRIEGLNDSKKLSAKKREALYEIIVEQAVAYCVCSVDEAEIDRLNILAASMLAMKQAVEGLQVRPDAAYIDGNRVPELEIPAIPVVKGDGKSASIAAASILAKVSRDRFLCQLDRQYPQYGFAKHKGYPTKEHYACIGKYGISPVHRKSFLKNLKDHIQ